MKWRIADFFIIALVLISALGIWLYPLLSAHGDEAKIKQGERAYTVSLKENAEIELSGAHIKIENGEISIIESSCPDKVCVNTGRISKKGESIVCAPNGIVVTIGGAREIDAVAN